LSGGEKLGLIIAVDEALDTVLSNRLGVHVGWKILDEQFTWIDSNSKEAILEFFKSKSYNKSYFIVDHTSEFNAAVDSRIIVRKRNGIARVEQ
jgi:DNA repair exonuclease SbcCD ATPase subunit